MPAPGSAPRGAIKHPINIASIQALPWIADLNKKFSAVAIDMSIIDELRDMSAVNQNMYDGAGKARLPVVRSKSDLWELQEQNAVCLARRDRLVEILVSYTEIQAILQKLTEIAEARFLELSDFRQLTNAESRRAFFNAVLPVLHDKKAKTERVISLCKVIQEHLDKTHFTIKQHAEMGNTILSYQSS